MTSSRARRSSASAEPRGQALKAPLARALPAFRQPGTREAAAVVAALAITSVLTVLAFRLWRADLSLAIGYGQRTDSKLYLSFIKGILDHGWYLHDANLGAPFGQDLRDYPTGDDNLNFLLIKALGVFSSNAGLVMNIFLLLGFPLVALSAYFAFRRLGVSRASTIVCSVLFALLPYHFYEREGHLFLAGYYAVPLGAHLVLSVFAGAPLFARRAGPHSKLLAWASGGSLLTLALCVVIGSTGQTYYGVFTVLLVLGAMLVVFAARRDVRALVTGAVVCAAITATLTANMLPTLIYRLEHGTNTQVAHRLPAESKKYGLQFAQMVLPSQYHRVGPLGDLSRRYNDYAPNTRFCEPCSATLGTVPTIGFLWLCVVGLAGCVGARRWFARHALFLYAAAAAAIAFVVGSVGGISALISYFVNSEIRAWDRLSVFIAFFSLLAVALLLDLLRRRWRSRSPMRLVFGGVLAVTLLGGALDQTTNYFVPDYRVDRREGRSDAAFVGAIRCVDT
jgi:phosphoglycerol transferase